MSDSQVLAAVMDLKQDFGGVAAEVKALRSMLESHARASQEAHDRITALEMHNARIRGAITVWGAVAGAVGSGLGFLVEYLLKSKTP